MKTYFKAAAIAKFYNALTPEGNVVTTTEKFRTNPLPTKEAATKEILRQISRQQRLYQLLDAAVEILQMGVRPVGVYDNADEEQRRQMSINVCKQGLLNELVEGQEIKPSTGKYWKLEDGELKLTHFFELSEGDVNPNFREEESTNKWYFIDSNTCLFTGSSKCAKHVAKHKDVWFKFI
jgi:hypothetical protein